MFISFVHMFLTSVDSFFSKCNSNRDDFHLRVIYLDTGIGAGLL